MVEVRRRLHARPIKLFRHVFPDPIRRDLAGSRAEYPATTRFLELSRLEFFTPRYEDFPSLNLARRAGETGGTLPAVMNAANEVAVAGFLDRQVRFPDIWQIVEEVMDRHTSVAHPDLDAILQADQWRVRKRGDMLDR